MRAFVKTSVTASAMSSTMAASEPAVVDRLRKGPDGRGHEPYVLDLGANVVMRRLEVIIGRQP